MAKKRQNIELIKPPKPTANDEERPRCFGCKDETYCTEDLCGKWFHLCRKAN
jgi:hypothetical protein